MTQTIISIIIIIGALFYLLRRKPSCKDKGCEGCKLKEKCDKKS